MDRSRYVTKSRFNLTQECPTKLFYADQPDVYENKNIENPFLEALAHGGFQVGALAKLYFPGGLEISAQEHGEAIRQTNELLSRDRVVIYEAAFLHKSFFIRVDILVKEGRSVELIEVKAKSFNPEEDGFYDQRLLKKGHYKIKSDWRPYLYDAAFQTHVCRQARTDLSFMPFLMLADKTKIATTDGLNQKFLLLDENGGTRVRTAPELISDSLGQQILCKIDVAKPVALIHEGRDLGEQSRAALGIPTFEEEISFIAEGYVSGQRLDPRLGTKCKNCEFRASATLPKRSGFNECWARVVPEEELGQPFVFDIWNFRKADALIEAGKILMRDVTKEDISPKKGDGSGLSVSERQWIQVGLTKEGKNQPFVDIEGLRREILAWRFPLHFIDFETTMVAIPFNAGRRPYEQVAFQFSHHIIHEDGRIEHAGEYINGRRGFFPNFDFVRELKAQLETDSGTILRYAHHENTVLCQIFEQLKTSSEPDRQVLMDWIRTVTRSTSSMEEKWEGPRCMIDMWELLKKYYYHPATNGSNSIKRVLPAVLQESKLLQEKYQGRIYGSSAGIRSLNFKDWVWLKRESSGAIVNPYRQLPKIFDGIDCQGHFKNVPAGRRKSVPLRM